MRIESDKTPTGRLTSMSVSVLRRAAVLWLRGFLLTAAAFAVTVPLARSLDTGPVYHVTRSLSDTGDPASLLEWLTPSLLFCAGTAAAGTTVFCRSFLRAGCVFRGIGTGLLFGLLSCGKLRLSHAAVAVPLCLAGLFLWLAQAAFAAVFSDELLGAFGTNNDARFRSVLRTSLSVTLALSGAVFLTSALSWLTAGAAAAP